MIFSKNIKNRQWICLHEILHGIVSIHDGPGLKYIKISKNWGVAQHQEKVSDLVVCAHYWGLKRMGLDRHYDFFEASQVGFIEYENHPIFNQINYEKLYKRMKTLWRKKLIQPEEIGDLINGD